MAGLPSGVVTFLFTDVVGSTRLWEADPAATSLAMARHDELIETAVVAAGGVLVRPRGEGDSRFAVFISPTAALTAAADFSVALAGELWPTSVPIRVRAAVGTGEADVRAGDYYGDVVNRTARLRSVGHPGQVLVAEATGRLVNGILPAGLGLLDLGVHRLKDLSRPERVFQLTYPGLPGEFPALLSLDRAKNNLPIQLSSLVGRDTDVAQVRTLMESSRLVTVTGFGGMGKTRLALQVAAELADGDGDGVWFIDLSAATDPARVPAAIAEALGIAETGQGTAAAVLAGIADKRLLLVLDNLEQIPECAPFVADLLAAAPQVRVLTTSRAPLHVRGEREYQLPPLSFGGAVGDADRLSSFSAVRLFIDRAVEARFDFTVTNENAPAVAAICARLDGHPLSIELAAARVKILSPQALLARLDSALSVLASTGGDRPDRQQTLAATITWSYDTLPAHEQLLLDCLSIFPGTVTLEAIEAVCGPVIGSDFNILDAVSSLVDKSLVRTHDPTGDDPDSRFSLLVSIRDYASQQLTGRGLTEEMQRRHAEHYTRFAPTEPAAEWDEVERLRSLATRDMHNMRAALTHLQDHGAVDDEVRLAALISDVVESVSFDETERICRHALSRQPAPSQHVFDFYQLLGLLYHYAGRHEESRRQHHAALELARRLGRNDLLTQAAIGRGWEAETVDELESLAREAEQALTATPAEGANPSRGVLLTIFQMLISGAFAYLDPDRSMAAARELLANTAGQDFQPFEGHHALALSWLDRGDYVAARAVLQPVEEQVLTLQNNPMSPSRFREALAKMYCGLGETARAVSLAEEGISLAESLIDEQRRPRSLIGLLLVLADCRFAQGRLSEAADVLTRAHAVASAARNDEAKGKAGWRLGRISRLGGDATAARHLVEDAWPLLASREITALPDMLGCLIERAIHLCDDAPDDAAQMLRVVRARQRVFVLPLAVAEEIAPLLDKLRDRLGARDLDHVLAAAADHELPT